MAPLYKLLKSGYPISNFFGFISTYTLISVVLSASLIEGQAILRALLPKKKELSWKENGEMKLNKLGFNWGDIIFGILGSSGFILFLYFFTSFS